MSRLFRLFQNGSFHFKQFLAFGVSEFREVLCCVPGLFCFPNLISESSHTKLAHSCLLIFLSEGWGCGVDRLTMFLSDKRPGLQSSTPR